MPAIAAGNKSINGAGLGRSRCCRVGSLGCAVLCLPHPLLGPLYALSHGGHGEGLLLPPAAALEKV